MACFWACKEAGTELNRDQNQDTVQVPMLDDSTAMSNLQVGPGDSLNMQSNQDSIHIEETLPHMDFRSIRKSLKTLNRVYLTDHTDIWAIKELV